MQPIFKVTSFLESLFHLCIRCEAPKIDGSFTPNLHSKREICSEKVQFRIEKTQSTIQKVTFSHIRTFKVGVWILFCIHKYWYGFESLKVFDPLVLFQLFDETLISISRSNKKRLLLYGFFSILENLLKSESIFQFIR